MKKYILLFAVMFSFFIAGAQTYLNLDVKKLNKALAEQKVSGFKFDSVSIYGGILGTYKDVSGGEMVIQFDSLNVFERISKNEKKNSVQFKKNNTNLIFFENDVIEVLYIELPAFKVCMSLTGFTTRAILEKLYGEINPEELLKKAVVK